MPQKGFLGYAMTGWDAFKEFDIGATFAGKKDVNQHCNFQEGLKLSTLQECLEFPQFEATRPGLYISSASRFQGHESNDDSRYRHIKEHGINHLKTHFLTSGIASFATAIGWKHFRGGNRWLRGRPSGPASGIARVPYADWWHSHL